MKDFDLKEYISNKTILKEGIWSIGNPDDIKLFIHKIKELQEDYHQVVGSDDVYDGLSRALSGAEDILGIAVKI